MSTCYATKFSKTFMRGKVAKIWRSCLQADLVLEDISNHSWIVDDEIVWVQEPFPDDIQAILVNENADQDDTYSDMENEESDSEIESSDDE